jgi:hypothetical protein
MFWEFFQHIQAVLRRGSCHQRLRIDRIWTARRQSNATVCTESGGFQDDPLDNAGADAERPGDLEDAVTFGPQFPYRRLDGRLDPSPAELRTPANLTAPISG